MTDKVDPSINSDGQAYMIAQTVRQHGAVGAGWIAASDTAYAADHPNSGITGAPLNAFAHVGTTNLDVTFDTGEAFIGGSWVARDTQTTISLADNTLDQTVVVGWDFDGGDTVKIGVPGTTVGASFSAKDPRIPLYTFDTDTGAVVATTDERAVGKTHSFGAAELGADSELARFLLTAAAAGTKGTPGNSVGELWRAGTDVSDLLMTVRASGRMNLAWNCYYDGSDWRYIVANEPAYRVAFGAGSVKLLAAAGGTADAIASFDGISVDDAGSILTAGGATAFDGANDEVPQSAQGGPAGSLSQYPIAAADVADGSGSGLDADTVDGYESSQLLGGEGEWALIDSHEDIDTATSISLTWGPLTTTYEIYRVVGRFTNFHDGSSFTFNECEIYVNNDSDNVYNQANLAAGTGVEAQANKNGWENLGKVEAGVDADGFFDVVIRGESHDSTAAKNHPTIGARHNAGTYDTWQLANGVMRKDYPTVDEFRLFSLAEATGEFYLYGKNL